MYFYYTKPKNYLIFLTNSSFYFEHFSIVYISPLYIIKINFKKETRLGRAYREQTEVFFMDPH